MYRFWMVVMQIALIHLSSLIKPHMRLFHDLLVPDESVVCSRTMSSMNSTSSQSQVTNLRSYH
jgi:hypothetical protein